MKFHLLFFIAKLKERLSTDSLLCYLDCSIS
nr:MAG TPA: Regulator of G protein signaling-like domain protein [Bacteriophage sp.]